MVKMGLIVEMGRIKKVIPLTYSIPLDPSYQKFPEAHCKFLHSIAISFNV